MTVDSFPGLPPWPEDVQTANLPNISFRKIRAGDDTEVDRLFQACKHWGFLLLDLRDTDHGSSLLKLADQVMEIGKNVFDLDLAEKKKYQMTKTSFDGYKGFGEIIVDSDGNKDRFESYGLGKDHLVGLKDVPSPAVIDESMSTLRSYIEDAHSLITTILDRLDGPLGLPNGTLKKLHRIKEPAGSQTRILKFPPQPAGYLCPSLVPHTDFGSITLLFNKLGGLQVLPPQETTAWKYVRPIPGHAIINIGDALVKLTRGLLRSNLHRVTYPPGAQAEHTRFSLAYLVRPEDTCVMKGLEGSSVIPKLAEGEVEDDVTIKDWIVRRTQMLNAETYKKEMWLLTRGTEEHSMKHGKPMQTETTPQMTASA